MTCMLQTCAYTCLKAYICTLALAKAQEDPALSVLKLYCRSLCGPNCRLQKSEGIMWRARHVGIRALHALQRLHPLGHVTQPWQLALTLDTASEPIHRRPKACRTSRPFVLRSQI